MKNSTALLSAITIFVLSSTNLYSEEITLNEITVTTTRMDKSPKSIPNTVTIVDQEALEKQIIINDSVSSILEKTVPGFAPSSQKMAGRGETLRGKNPTYMIDGVPQHNSLRDGQRDGFTIDPDFLERVEVIHGANAIQGIGATGGIVGMTTKSAKGDGKWHNELKLGITTDDGFESDGLGHKVTYIGSIKKENFDFVGGVSYQKRGLFFDAKGDSIGLYAVQGDIMDSTSRDVFLKFGYEADENQRIQIMINDFEMENNGGFTPVKGDRKTGKYATNIKGSPSAKVGDPAKNDVTTVSLDYSHANIGDGELRSQLYYQDYAARFEGGTFVSKKSGLGLFRLTPDGAPFLDQSEIQSKKYGLKISYTKPNLGGIAGLNTLIGFDYSSDTSNQSLTRSGRKWVPDMEMVSTAPFVQADYNIGNLLLSVGVRYEANTLQVDDFTTIANYKSTFVEGGEPSFKELLKNVGMVYYINDELSAYASYSEGFDMADVGRVLRGIKTPNQNVKGFLDLKPVITKNKEIGVDYDDGELSVHIAYYKTDTAFGSRLKRNDNNIFEVKREKQEIDGFDFTLGYIINDDISIGLNYAKINGEFDSDGDGSVDTDLSGVNISPNRLNLFVDANIYNIGTRLQLSHLFDRTYEGKNVKKNGSEKFDGYNLLDLFLAKETSYGTFSLGIENLLNEDYVTYFSQTEGRQRAGEYFAGRGRTLTLNYKIEF